MVRRRVLRLLIWVCTVCKEDIAESRGLLLISSDVEDQILENIIFKILLHIPDAQCLRHSGKEHIWNMYVSGLLLLGDNSVLFTPMQEVLK